MIKYENECVDCGFSCLGDSCPNRNVPRLYCDQCGSEEELREYEGEQWCDDCILAEFEKVEV